jgi:hypothetical protein
LGLASTRELLLELQVRGHVGMLAKDANAGECGLLEEKAGNLLATLTRPVLEYRPMD